MANHIFGHNLPVTIGQCSHAFIISLCFFNHPDSLSVLVSQCSMSLPEAKLEALKPYLLEFSLQFRASERQLQVLVGKLNWACRITYGGHTFLGRTLDQVNQLTSPKAKFKFNEDFYADLSWWISFLSVFNGKTLFLEEVPATDV